MTRTILMLTILASAALGAGCGGKANQSPDGGRGGGGADGAQTGGADGHAMPEVGMDTPAAADVRDAPSGTDARDAADAPSGADATDAPSGTDARDAPAGVDATDAPSGADAPADITGTGPDGGNLPGVWYELGGSGTGEGLDPGTGGSDPAIAIDVLGHPLVAWHSHNLHPGVSFKHWNGSAWTALGFSDRDDGVAWNNGGSGAPGFATTGGGVPILAWTAGPAMARQWRARAWESIGPSATTAGLSNGVSADMIAMAIDGAQRPVVAWRVTPASSLAASKVMLRAWDGTSWVERGGSATGNGVSGMVIVRGLDLAVDAQGRMVLAWEEWGNTSATTATVRVKRWNGTAWEALDAPLASGGMSPRVAMDRAGRPILAWFNRTGTSGVYLQRWSGTAWEELGGSASGGGVSRSSELVQAQAPAIAIDEKDRIVVAWHAIYPAGGGNGQGDVYARMWDGQVWNDLGGSASGNGISGTPEGFSEQIAVAARGNRVCVTWNEGAGAIRMRCFDVAPKFCSCDTSAGCEAGCACDVNCVTPAWDDFVCPAGAYRCHDGRCVTGVVACNGVSECADGSDESPLCPNGTLFDSPRGTGCGGWPCANGECGATVRCNRLTECADGSDEDAVCDLPSTFVREPINVSTTFISSGDVVRGLWAGPSGAWAAAEGGIMLHRDAGGWARQPFTFGSYDLVGTWGSGSALVLVPLNGSLVSWNGSGWSLLNFPTSSFQMLTGIWGTGPNDIWTVGYSTVSGSPTSAVAWHGTGPTTWTAIDPQLATRLLAVGGSATDDVWAVGEQGAILHGNGSTFSPTTSGTTNRIYAVWASARDNAWAGGEQGMTLRWTGGPSWTPSAPVTQAIIYGIWGASASDVWAVGSGGAVLHWNGTKWTNVWSGTSEALRSITGFGPDIWIGGQRGYILHLAR